MKRHNIEYLKRNQLGVWQQGLEDGGTKAAVVSGQEVILVKQGRTCS